MISSLRFAFGLSLMLASIAAPAAIAPSPAAAQQEEARALFEQGNAHLARGLRARGRARARALEQALDAYLGVLRLGTRTRNVVFNTALTLAELERNDEAFNYYSEYLRAFDLSDDERAEGQRRIDALRPSVAVIRVESTPPGAEVRVGRRDLPVRGATPIELALPPGAHPVFLTRAGYAEASGEATAAVGSTATLTLTLAPEPVAVQVIAPAHGRLTLDDRVIEPGRTIAVVPGAHVVRLEVEGAPPIERRFEVSAGDPTLVLELSAPAATGATQTQVALAIDTPAEVFLDELPVGRGARLAFPARPGAHVLRVSAPGRTPLVHPLTLAPAEALSLSVELGAAADETGIHIARAILGSLAIAAAGASIGLGVHTLELSDEWNRQIAARWQDTQEPRTPSPDELKALGLRVEDAALLTDIALATTAALGVAALIAIIVGPGSGEASAIRVGAGPTAGTGVVASMSWSVQ